MKKITATKIATNELKFFFFPALLVIIFLDNKNSFISRGNFLLIEEIIDFSVFPLNMCVVYECFLMCRHFPYNIKIH